MLVLAVRQIYRIEELSYRWAVCLLMLLTKRITAHEDFAFQFLSLLSSVLNAQGGEGAKRYRTLTTFKRVAQVE